MKIIPTRRTRQTIANDFGFSQHFIDLAIVELRKYPERYPNSVISSGHICLIDVEMMFDWIKYRNALDTGQVIPPFKRSEYRIDQACNTARLFAF